MKICVTVYIEEDHGSYHAFCPAFKGLHVDGATEHEALEHAKDAVDAYLFSLAKHNDPLPLCVQVESGLDFIRRSFSSLGRRQELIVTEVPLPA